MIYVSSNFEADLEIKMFGGNEVQQYMYVQEYFCVVSVCRRHYGVLGLLALSNPCVSSLRVTRLCGISVRSPVII